MRGVRDHGCGGSVYRSVVVVVVRGRGGSRGSQLWFRSVVSALGLFVFFTFPRASLDFGALFPSRLAHSHLHPQPLYPAPAQPSDGPPQFAFLRAIPGNDGIGSWFVVIVTRLGVLVALLVVALTTEDVIQ